MYPHYLKQDYMGIIGSSYEYAKCMHSSMAFVARVAMKHTVGLAFLRSLTLQCYMNESSVPDRSQR